jgi:hypothetical protein
MHISLKLIRFSLRFKLESKSSKGKKMIVAEELEGGK